MPFLREQDALSDTEARLELLLQASELLGRSLDYDLTLANLASLLVPRMADGYVVDLVDEQGTIRRVAAIDHDPAKAPLMAKLRSLGAVNPKASSGIQRILEDGVPILNERMTNESLEKGARDAEHLATMQKLDLHSGLIIPLKARGRAIGLLWLYFSTSKRTYARGDLALGEEIAARAALAIDNARLVRELGEAVKARENFLAIASHELRTPITSLMLRIQSHERSLAKNPAFQPSREEIAGWLSSCNRQIGRINRLVDEMLDVSRLTTGHIELARETFDLGAALREVVSELEDESRRKCAPITLDAADGIVGTWDRLRIGQVARNVLLNAMKYGEGKPIAVSLRPEGDRAVIRVRDEGIGIDPAHLTRIFDRFERMVSSRNYGGFGLGLWIARQIVERSGGTIRAESRLGEGATFIVELPLSAARQDLE